MFRLAVATFRAPTDPTYALEDALAAPVVTHRPAITDEKQLGALMLEIDLYKGWPMLRSSLQFLALTMMRPGEVRHMRRNEVIWPTSTWRIPAERMKMRRPHDVPLSKQALAILRDVWPLTMDDNLVSHRYGLSVALSLKTPSTAFYGDWAMVPMSTALTASAHPLAPS